MKYDDPRLRVILSGEYVLGMLPPLARARFERLMRFDAGLVRLVGDWAERFAPVDEVAATARPPARVWRIVKARTTTTAARPEGRRWRDPTILWRRLAMGAGAVAVALAIDIALTPPSGPEPVVAVLADSYGEPGWVVTADKAHAALAVASVRNQSLDRQHSYQLWVIADNKPHSLGLVAPEADRPVEIPDTALPKNGLAFAVSLEPTGGSPTGLPTGPVLYRGKVLFQ